jgi:SAM-dependent methyltransferase
MTASSSCRSCGNVLATTFVDLGMSPLSNSFLKPSDLSAMERFYPLHAFVCNQCYLVQLEEFESPETIFSDYLYFSSYSSSWLRHAACYSEMITKKHKLSSASFVVELASNDGYLLQNFVSRGIPCLGIEPAANVAEEAVRKGVPTRSLFFGTETARNLVHEGLQADLVIANNVLAHVPDINDFVSGVALVLKPSGVVTLEFPHLIELINNNQFDTIYHEHFSYLSLLAVETILNRHGLAVFAVDQLSTHGGSIRVYAQLQKEQRWPVEGSVDVVRAVESAAKLSTIATYANFHHQVEKVKRDLLTFLIQAKEQGKRVVAYGAAAKGNTLLNYCGVRRDFIDFVVDRSPHKQGLFTPGTHIPVYHPDRITEARPDYVLILPWNLKQEVAEQLRHIRSWGGKFVVPIPNLEVF